MTKKTCTGCGKTKPRSEFHKHAPSKDGLKPRCKPCQREAEARRRLEPDHKAVQAWHDLNKRVQNQPEYAGVEVRVTRDAFVAWATDAFARWFVTHPDVRPSVDREDPAGHYEISNLRVIPLGENSRRARNHHNVHAPSGKAWCAGCLTYKFRSDFERNAGKPHGLQNYCRPCRRTRRISDSLGRPGAARSSAASLP
jgi:hypothetical protein